MKTTLLVLAIAAGTALTAGHASAQERGPIGFEALDLNSDGQVTLEEMQGQGAAVLPPLIQMATAPCRRMSCWHRHNPGPRSGRQR